MEQLRSKSGFICDMDGVIYHGDKLLPGAKEFIDWLKSSGKKFLFLTNSSEKTPQDLHDKLARMGVDVGVDHFYTSALSMARFLSGQMPGCKAYVIGGHGLTSALTDAGVTITSENPDYVVVGETPSYNYESIVTASILVSNGARLVATNSDISAPFEGGIKPSCGALVAPIEVATGKKAYFVGKPNPLMMRTGLRMLGVHSSDAAIVGDRMDTDIIAGVETGLDTCLVLSGVTSEEEIANFPYRPRLVANGVGDIVPA